ncbi:MAG: hypothetical protein ACFFC7_09050 [Candidatus Hermodarchaeota archaeon]
MPAQWLKKSLQMFYQKNVLFTLLAFLIGLLFNLSEITMVLLIVIVASVSTWWQWHPQKPDLASQLISETLKTYPAIFVKGYTHLIALEAIPPKIASVYRCSIPRSYLKRHLSNIEDKSIQASITQFQENAFLILQCSFSPFTRLNKLFQEFKAYVESLEIAVQGKFVPAERFELVHLFGLDIHLKHKKREKKEERKDKISTETIKSTMESPSVLTGVLREESSLLPIVLSKKTSISPFKELKKQEEVPSSLLAPKEESQINLSRKVMIAVVEMTDQGPKLLIFSGFSIISVFYNAVMENSMHLDTMLGDSLEEGLYGPLPIKNRSNYHIFVFNTQIGGKRRFVLLFVDDCYTKPLFDKYERLERLLTVLFRNRESIIQEDLEEITEFITHLLSKEAVTNPMII